MNLQGLASNYTNMIINQNYKGNTRQKNILMVLPGITEKQSNSRQKKVYSIYKK